MTEIPNVTLDSRSDTILASPDKVVKVREAFGVDSDLEVPAFSEADERVPDLDPAYVFDPDTTLAIAAGASPLEPAIISNHAAGVVVGKVGTATVSANELLQSFSNAR